MTVGHDQPTCLIRVAEMSLFGSNSTGAWGSWKAYVLVLVLSGGDRQVDRYG
jgi:hypothetical protein